MLESIFTSDQWNPVEVAFGIRICEVDGGWGKSISHGKRGDCKFHASGSIQQMTVHGFCRVHTVGRGVGTEDVMNSAHFDFTILFRGSAMRTDVSNVSGSVSGVCAASLSGLAAAATRSYLIASEK